MHYLEGTSQGEIANSLGVNQSTISRRLKEGIESLRVELRRLGVVVPAATLLTWFHTSSAVAASPSLDASISKIGLVGVGTSTVSTSAGWNIVSSLYSVLKATSALLVVPLVAGVYWGEIAFLTVFLFWGGYLYWRQPEWVRVLCFTRQYPNIYQWPFFPFSRWKWNSPPPEWRIWFSYHLLVGVQLFGLAMLPTSTRFWLIPVAGGTLHFLMAIRIWWRVRRCRLEGVEESPTPSAPVDGALLLTYFFAGLLLIAKLGSSPWFLSQPADRSDVFWLKLGCIISWCSLLVWGTFLVVSRFRRWRKQGKADFATTQRISELAPPRWVLTLLLGIPLLLALSITYLALMLDVLPVFVPLGDDTLSVVRRSMFRINLFALDLSVLGILPLAYLHRRIPRVAWGVAAGSVGLIGLLHFGLFTTTILATPDIKGQVYYGQTPRLVFASDQFTLWNPPNLLQNDSLKPDNPFLGSNLVLEVTVAVNSIVMIELGSHQVQLLSPVLKPHTLGEVSSAVMIVPDDLQNGIPRQMQVTLILVGPNRSQQMKQFTLPLPKDITSTEWHAQFQFRDFYEESAHPIGEAVQLGTIQGTPLIVRVETDESLIHAVP